MPYLFMWPSCQSTPIVKTRPHEAVLVRDAPCLSQMPAGTHVTAYASADMKGTQKHKISEEPGVRAILMVGVVRTQVSWGVGG